MRLKALYFLLATLGLNFITITIVGILWIHLILNLYPRAFGLHLVFAASRLHNSRYPDLMVYRIKNLL
jgi:hypothetical protein